MLCDALFGVLAARRLTDMGMNKYGEASMPETGPLPRVTIG